jgi:hypothetical protein
MLLVAKPPPSPARRLGLVIYGRVLLAVLVVACASVPERVGKPLSNAVYRAPEAAQLPDSMIATLELGDVDWIRIDSLLVDHTEYGSVKLPPAVHCIEMGKVFGVSVLVDPRIWAEHSVTGKVSLEAGRTYRLASDRSHGIGYMVWFQLMDAAADSIIPIVEEPRDFLITGPISPGVPVTGALDAGDSTRFDCSYYEAYSLDISADTAVEITLESEDFDPYLVLVSPSGEFVATEDAGEGQSEVHVEKDLEENGRWLVIANALKTGETGRYRLVLERR